MSSVNRHSSARSIRSERSTNDAAVEPQYFRRAMTPFRTPQRNNHRSPRHSCGAENAQMSSFVTRPGWPFSLWLLFASSVPAAESFEDCAGCSRMVVIPGGTFTMGSPENEPERKKFEGPRSSVKVESFAIGATEVTRGQYALFVKETARPPPAHGCFTFGFNDIFDSSNVEVESMDPKASWRIPAFKQRDDHPATCVSWQDAQDYAAWLARKTGRPYRLPSEAEWEYAARAGSASIFFWGSDETAACRYANVGDQSLKRKNAIVRGQIETALRAGQRIVRFVECEDGSPYTTVAGRYQPNSFGLYDMIGSVWEYVEDCWQESLPESGRAYEEAGCQARRVRGGSWDDAPAELRSARRSRVKPDLPRNDGGFRVALDLGSLAAHEPHELPGQPATVRAERVTEHGQ
jgi:formylglycine-generating enzyme required for sulfatase activity